MVKAIAIVLAFCLPSMAVIGSDSSWFGTTHLNRSPLGVPGDSCAFLNNGVIVHVPKSAVISWLGSLPADSARIAGTIPVPATQVVWGSGSGKDTSSNEFTLQNSGGILQLSLIDSLTTFWMTSTLLSAIILQSTLPNSRSQSIWGSDSSTIGIAAFGSAYTATNIKLDNRYLRGPIIYSNKGNEMTIYTYNLASLNLGTLRQTRLKILPNGHIVVGDTASTYPYLFNVHGGMGADSGHITWLWGHLYGMADSATVALRADSATHIPMAYISVRDFGALGNGSNDDASTIQAALNSAAAGTIKTVYFPEGQYLINSSLNINDSLNIKLGNCRIFSAIQGFMVNCNSSNVKFSGNGNASVIQNTDATGIGSGIIIHKGLSGVKFENLSFKNFAKFPDDGLDSTGNRTRRLYDCAIYSEGDDDWYHSPTYGNSNIIISNCRFEEGQNSIMFAFTVNSKINNCSFYQSLGRGIDLWSSNDIGVSSMTFIDSNRTAVNGYEQLSTGGYPCISNCIYNSTIYGTCFEGANICGNSTVLSGVTFTDYGETGVQLLEPDGTMISETNGDIVSNCTFRTHYGYHAVSVKDNTYNKAVTHYGSNNHIILNNTIIMLDSLGKDGRENAGVEIQTYCNGCKVNHNMIIGGFCNHYGITVSGSKNEITYNHCIGGTDFGIFLKKIFTSYNGPIDTNFIEYNECEGFNHGIHVEGSTRTSIQNNYCHDNLLVGSWGIIVTGTAAADMIYKNNRLARNTYSVSFQSGTSFDDYDQWTVGLTANRPNLTSVARVGYLDNTITSTGEPIWWNGTAWVQPLNFPELIVTNASGQAQFTLHSNASQASRWRFEAQGGAGGLAVNDLDLNHKSLMLARNGWVGLGGNCTNNYDLTGSWATLEDSNLAVAKKISAGDSITGRNSAVTGTATSLKDSTATMIVTGKGLYGDTLSLSGVKLTVLPANFSDSATAYTAGVRPSQVYRVGGALKVMY